MRIRLGLKAWSTNLSIIPAARELYDRGDLDYVEVFCVPGSAAETAGPWAASKLPCIVHAPHSMSGLNFSLPEMETQNADLARESLRFADVLKSDMVIFHPGTQGRIEETVRQMLALRDPRMIVENKPYRGLDGSTCVGSRPEEIRMLIDALSLGFCLDFGHAIAASNSHGVPPLEYVARFMALGPVLFHLTDGEVKSDLDHHASYGQGSFPIRELLALIPDGSMVTDEAKRTDPDSLSDYLRDRRTAEALLDSGRI